MDVGTSKSARVNMLFQYPTDCNCKHTQCRLIRFGYVISTEVLLDIMLHGAQPDTHELFGQMLVLLSCGLRLSTLGKTCEGHFCGRKELLRRLREEFLWNPIESKQ